ncbi:hypothetical protein ACFOSS_10930 [Pseudaeromonas sharmana]|uniref:Restriction endonuclease subunit S n=1 Tax=Pseudaeromonas sharmana TaxID=328412 RepID=A0ABV8CP67_9GAMM
MSSVNQQGIYKSYADYKKTDVDWIGDIPNEWTTKRVKHMFSICKRIAGELGFDVLSITQRGIIVKDIESGEGQLSMDYSKYQRVKPGDFAMNHMDLLTGYIDLSRFDGVTSPDYRVFKLIKENYSPRYYLYIFQMGYNLRIFFHMGQGASHLGRWRLATDEFNEMLFPVPSPEEQLTIATFLDYETARIDQLIAKQQQLIELLKEKRQAVISHAVTKGLNPNAPMKDSGVEWLGQVPEHWVVGRYKFCCSRVIVGIAEAATHAYVDQGIPLVRSTNIKETGLDCGDMLYLEPKFAAQNITKKLKVHDVITVRTGYPGISAVIPEVLDGSQCFTNLVATPLPVHESEFLSTYLNSVMGKSYFDLNAWGSAQKNISVPILQNFPISWPSQQEQLELVSFCKKINDKFNRLIYVSMNGIKLLQERRTALISAAVTGKIDLRGWQPPQSEEAA